MAPGEDIQQSIHKALQANKDHQYALRIYSERIDAELESLNKLLVRLHYPTGYNTNGPTL